MRLDIGYEYRSIFIDRRREHQMLTPRGSIWVSMLSDMFVHPDPITASLPPQLSGLLACRLSLTIV